MLSLRMCFKAKRRKQEELEKQKIEDQAKKQQVGFIACLKFYI